MLSHNPRRARILGLALPIIGGMVSQNILNLVDTAMVGHLGDAALAAVGMGGFASFTAMALILGIAVGVQATAARRKGQGRYDEMAVALTAGLLVVVCVAPPFSIILYQCAPIFYPVLVDDPEVIGLGNLYLQIRVFAITFVACNFAFRGYWNAVDRSRLYLITLLIMHSCNICLNYVLIFGKLGFPELGVTGAGIGSAVSTAIGTATYIYLGFKFARGEGFFQKMPTRGDIRRIVGLSIPSGIQQFFFSAGMTTMYWIIAQIGTAELAAASVLINLTLVALLPGIGLGISAATLVGQALGRGEPDDAKQWAWDVVKVSFVLLGTLGVPMWLVPDLLLGGFLHDPETLAVARIPMRLIGLTMVVEAVGIVLMHSLLGAGDVHRVMRISISCQWLYFLPLAYLIGPVLGYGLLAVWLLNISYRVLIASVFALLWQRGKWATIKV
ncbi:MAG TPA: MATE family efflux transporter [Gammaproteobacteria bacterium]|nr:MATE family efflux transporter [Gammaproteobacteria bacterium]